MTTATRSKTIHRHSVPGKRHITIKHPVGVVAAISPPVLAYRRVDAAPLVRAGKTSLQASRLGSNIRPAEAEQVSF